MITSNVTSRLMGIKLLKRMMKVKKFRPKFAAPPSETVRRGRTRKENGTKRKEGWYKETESVQVDSKWA